MKPRLFISLILCVFCVSAIKADYTNGIFILNEDWYGHNSSSMNFYNNSSDEVEYRVFSSANDGECYLGNTSQFAQIFGDKIYIISKQNYGNDESTGGRLIVADAKTLQQEASISDLDGKDGRSFVGVNEHIGYVGTSAGIYLFDMKQNKLGDLIDGTGSETGGIYSGQIGDMVRFQDFVFATKQNVGVLVINTSNHNLVSTIELPDISTIFVTSAGELYAASTNTEAEFVKINPNDFSTKSINIDNSLGNAFILSTWGAWRSGSVAVDPKENSIYYYNTEYAKNIIKYNFDTQELITDFITLPENQVMYATGVSINPISREMLLTTTEEGYTTHFSNNWLLFVNLESREINKSITLDKHYWFPAMALYPDNYSPEIDLSQISLSVNDSINIDLKSAVSDFDNNASLIVFSVEIENPEICQMEQLKYGEYSLSAIANGETLIAITADSNGHITTKTIKLTVSPNSGIDFIECDNAPVEYYNLHGVKIDNPQNGIFIRKQGNKIDKIIKH